jgi:hypothetical protein
VNVWIHKLTFDAKGRITRAEFRCREVGIRRQVRVAVVWKDVAGDWCWFKAGWCSPENWREIVPMLAGIERVVDSLPLGDGTQRHS